MTFPWREAEIKTVKDPNTPLKELLALARFYPEEFLSNPVFNTILLEMPDFLEKFGVYEVTKLLKTEKCPQWFVEFCYKKSDKLDRNGKWINAILLKYPNQWTKLRELDKTIKKTVNGEFYSKEFTNVDFSFYEMITCSLQFLQFNDCYFDSAMFFYSDLDHIEFNQEKLISMFFANSEIYDTVFNVKEFKNINFSGCTLEETKFINSSFLKCDFSYVKFCGVNLDNATFNNCDFSYSEFQLEDETFVPFNSSYYPNATFLSCTFS